MKEGQSGSSVEAGEPVMCGATVRIGHLQTERNLHSHLFSSPLSNQQEVRRGTMPMMWCWSCRNAGRAEAAGLCLAPLRSACWVDSQLSR